MPVKRLMKFTVVFILCNKTLGWPSSPHWCQPPNKLIGKGFLKFWTEFFRYIYIYIYRYIVNSIQFSISPTTHRRLLSNIHILAIKPTFSQSNIHHSMVLLNGIKCRSIICNLSMPHTKYFQYLNSNELLYTIKFNYVTFADIWIGRHYVIATDYERYIISKLCLPQYNRRKSRPCKYFTCMT